MADISINEQAILESLEQIIEKRQLLHDANSLFEQFVKQLDALWITSGTDKASYIFAFNKVISEIRKLEDALYSLKLETVEYLEGLN